MLTKIEFIDFDADFYRIVSFENIMSSYALPAKYTQDFPYYHRSIYHEQPAIFLITEHELFPKKDYSEVRCKYITTGIPFKLTKNGDIISVSNSTLILMEGTYIFKNDLPKLISVMKKAGQRLAKINQKKKVFTITI